MKILIINSVCGIKSTGRICSDIASSFENDGHEVKIAYGRGEVPENCQKYAVRIGNRLDLLLHGLMSRLFDAHGLGSVTATRRFLRWAEEYNPDLLWLHNIHGYYINYELLFAWIKKRPELEVKWTLHDCWAFTGHCSHFESVGCNKWKSDCIGCIQTREYPASFFDFSNRNYRGKQHAFTGVKKLTIITPCMWLRNLVKESFLAEYTTEVVYNTIDKSVFKYTPSDFREKYNLQDKKIVLGVATAWCEAKGLNDFLTLSELLPAEYKIVLVGLTDNQIKVLPKKILGLRRTNSKEQLAKIYSAANIFANLSHDETFPTVNLEAQACGIPIVTYNVGGSLETLLDFRSCCIKDDCSRFANLEQAIKNIT